MGQDVAELLARMKAMEARIQSLEAEVQALKGQPAAAPAQANAPPTVAATAGGQLPVYGGAAAAASKVFNPDISVIGDFVGAAGNPGPRSTPSLEMHESELGLQAIIDPYARGDFFLTFGEHGVDLEEGYITFTSLPGALQLRAGKMRAAFGLVNTMHNHVLPWIDRPLVTQNLVAGEDGINDAGLSLSRIIPAPGQIFLEGTAQLYRGDTEGLFQATRRSDLSTVEHLRAYRDISESTNVSLGGSFARGHSPFADANNQLYGIDATIRWKPLRRAIYRSFVARSELVWTRLAQPPARPATPFGYYVAGDYQFGRRWFLGGRFDRSERGVCQPTLPATVPAAACVAAGIGPLTRDTGGSVLLTYWPSEFSQIRGQLRRTEYGGSFTANEFLFQFIFSLGAHGAHPF
ncbi:MAG: hypothetical protein C5B51_03285 [Terriglobia bacterium]|nr:MAG: hypothetical protein C5B51_03285 [Terriglobia bacterium]